MLFIPISILFYVDAGLAVSVKCVTCFETEYRGNGSVEMEHPVQLREEFSTTSEFQVLYNKVQDMEMLSTPHRSASASLNADWLDDRLVVN